MTNPLLRGMLAVLPLVAMGCIDSTPSSGQCTVTFNGQTSTWTIDPGESHFYREDDILGDEDAPVALRYGGGQVRVQGELDDMPTSSYVGTHRVPSEDRVRRWDIEHAPAMSSTHRDQRHLHHGQPRPPRGRVSEPLHRGDDALQLQPPPRLGARHRRLRRGASRELHGAGA
jgi:hypothetical protein